MDGQQIKKSLKTTDKALARIFALKILEKMTINKFKIDLKNGIFQADGEEDTKNMLSVLGQLKALEENFTPLTPSRGGALKKGFVGTANSVKNSLTLIEVLDKLFLLKSDLKQATVLAYKNTIKEFEEFLKCTDIQEVLVSDVSRFQEHLAKNNSIRTIDNKVAIVRALFNFAIKQGYYFEKNPAQERSLQSKKNKILSGYEIFNEDEIKLIFTNENYFNEKTKDEDFYWVMLLAVLSGCRVSEITSLKKDQIKVEKNFFYIELRDSKTLAGIRKIPIPIIVYDFLGFKTFIDLKTDRVFKYKEKLGKGSGTEVGKKFSRLLEKLKLNERKLVFHSIRKFTNDFFLKKRISLETRCQFFGHELDNVNVQSYTTKQSIEEIFQQVEKAQNEILKIIKIL